MSHDILMRIVELFAGILFEGIILGFIFQMISNKSQESQRKELQKEMYRIESQNRHNTEMLMADMKDLKHDLVDEIHELLP